MFAKLKIYALLLAQNRDILKFWPNGYLYPGILIEKSSRVKLWHKLWLIVLQDVLFRVWLKYSRAHQTHYEQMGHAHGTLSIDGQTRTLSMDSFRDHSFGKNPSETFSILQVLQLSLRALGYPKYFVRF